MNEVFILSLDLSHYVGSQIFFGWNLVNFIEGEGPWIAKVAAFSVLAAFITTILYFIKTQFLTSKNYIAHHPVWVSVIVSFYTPLLVLIWYAMGICSLNVVSDNLLSDLFLTSYTSAVKIGVLLSFAWAFLRLKNGVVKLISRRQIYPTRTIDAPTLNILSKVATIIILLFVVILFHDIAGLSMTTLLAFSGVGGLAIAFATQDIIANFFGSLMLHIIRPFVIGEDIAVPSVQVDGKVEEIGWYQTRIRSSIDTTTVYMPNSLFSKAIVLNKTRFKNRFIQETIYIKLSSDRLLSYIKELKKVIEQNPTVMADHRVSVWIHTLYGSSAKIGIYAALSVTDYNLFLSIRDELLIQSADMAQKYDGELIMPPENHQIAMVLTESKGK